MLTPGGDGSHLGRRARPVLGDHCLVGKRPEGSRQLEFGQLPCALCPFVRFLIEVRLRSRRRLGLLVALDLLDNPLDNLLHLVGGRHHNRLLGQHEHRLDDNEE